jgi:pimeloyl-ACP methyl ester carboxylesterase
MDLADRFLTVDGVRLHYVETGEGPLVVLLHGFPEFWWSWRHQIPALAAAGFRVVALDMRGYAQSDAPPHWRDYRGERLAADVAGVIEQLSDPEIDGGRAHVVGHDWGAVVAWAVATLHPDRVRRVAILNVPHPETMLRTLRRSPKQLMHSWYIFFFQIPRLPEWLAGRFGRRFLEGAYRDARPGAFTPEDYARYEQALLRSPGGLKGPIDYYRAAIRQTPKRAREQFLPIAAKVLVIWGEQDRFLSREMATPDPVLVPDVRVVRLPDASHWVQHDEPERVSTLLTEHLSGA